MVISHPKFIFIKAMKKFQLYLYFHLLYLCAFSQHAFINQYFDLQYDNTPLKIIEGDKNTYYLSSGKFDGTTLYAIIYKIDTAGNVTDSLIITPPQGIYSCDIAKIEQLKKIGANDYFGIGCISTQGSPYCALWIIRFDSLLNISVDKRYPLLYHNATFYGDIVLKDSLITIVNTMLFQDQMSRLYFQLSLNGDTLKSKIAGNSELAFDLLGFAKTNQIYSIDYIKTSLGPSFSWIKIDSVFNESVICAIPGSLKMFTNGEFISTNTIAAFGTFDHFPGGVYQRDLKLVTFDTIGNIYHSVVIGNPGVVDYVGERSLDYRNGDIFVSYTEDYEIYGPQNYKPSIIHIIKADTLCNIVWDKKFGGDQYYEQWNILATSDGGCIVLAKSYQLQPAPLDGNMYIIKLDRWGNAVSNIAIPQINNASIYPNPGSHGFYLHLASIWNETFVEVYQTNGNKVLETKITTQNHYIDMRQYPSGLYFVVISQNGKAVARQKWLKTE